jgi:hypothetical protein
MNLFEAVSQAPGGIFHDPDGNSDLHHSDNRLAHLLLLLRQVDTSIDGLAAIPENELSEIISAALRVCGFVESIEAYQAVAIVLDALERQYPMPDI